jgi:hypothetical protein
MWNFMRKEVTNLKSTVSSFFDNITPIEFFAMLAGAVVLIYILGSLWYGKAIDPNVWIIFWAIFGYLGINQLTQATVLLKQAVRRPVVNLMAVEGQSVNGEPLYTIAKTIPDSGKTPLP